MLEEDFGTTITKLLALTSCLKYIENPGTKPWNPEPTKKPDGPKGDEDVCQLYKF